MTDDPEKRLPGDLARAIGFAELLASPAFAECMGNLHRTRDEMAFKLLMGADKS